MLKKIKSAIENSQPKKISCEACGSESLWQARRSPAWNCSVCSPPSSEAIVAQRIGPAIASEPVRTTSPTLAGSTSVSEPIAAPIAYLAGSEICECGSILFFDLPIRGRIFSVCGKCHRDIAAPKWGA